MKKILAQIMLAVPVWFMLGSISFAMCIWFVPPSRQFAPATNMKTLIAQDGNQVTMTVQPQFSGDATDFALVMPFPSEPTVSEAPELIFTELEDLTNPVQQFDDFIALDGVGFAESSAASEEVRIIEERDVGDFSTVTLSATSESALATWLENEGYELTDEKRDIITQYVNSDGYFIALKVNMEEAEVDSSGFLTGELKPITFSFESSNPMLPLRLMSGDSALVTLTVYTLNDQLTYIPGAEIQFSKKVDASQLKDAPALEQYDAWQKWLVRNVVQVQTDDVENDLGLLQTVETRVVVPGEQPIILNPDQLPLGTGVVVSDNGLTIYTDETAEEKTPAEPVASSRVTNAMVVVLAISNVVLLAILIATQNSKPNPHKITGKK